MEQQLEYEKKRGKEKDKALGEKDKALGEKDKALGKEKNKSKQLQVELAKTLKENGVPTATIQQKTNLSKEEINKL